MGNTLFGTEIGVTEAGATIEVGVGGVYLVGATGVGVNTIGGVYFGCAGGI